MDRLVISSSAFRLSLSFFKGGKRVMDRVVAGCKTLEDARKEGFRKRDSV